MSTLLGNNIYVLRTRDSFCTQDGKSSSLQSSIYFESLTKSHTEFSELGEIKESIDEVQKVQLVIDALINLSLGTSIS